MSEIDNTIKFMVEAQLRASTILLVEKDRIMVAQEAKINELEQLLESANSMIEQQASQIQELQKEGK